MFENRPSKSKSKRDDQPRKKIPRKITETYLHNAGLYYLERFASSAENFRAVMSRKIKRSCMHHTEQNYDECIEMLDKMVEKFIKVDLLNDQVYTRSKVNAMRRKGKSSRFIHASLRAKGLDADLIARTLNEHDHEHFEDTQTAELKAAQEFTRKKRLGAYSTKTDQDPQKELAKMARAGFSYDTAQRALKNSHDQNDPY